MNERKFDHGSRIDTADEGTLERSVGLNIFETLNDGLVSKPITPCAAAWAAAFAVRVIPGGSEASSSTRSLGLHIASSSIQPLLTLLTRKIR